MSNISLELCAPRTQDEQSLIRQAIPQMRELSPDFISVTHGAGGFRETATEKTVTDLQQEQLAPVVPHCISVGRTRNEIIDLLARYEAVGIGNILALRGDKPVQGSSFAEIPCAIELVHFIKSRGAFTIGVAVHPDGHPDSPDQETDRRLQAAKLKAADYAITQFFFESESYHRLVDDLNRRGADSPVIPGVMLPGSVAGLDRITGLSKIPVPGSVRERFVKAAAQGKDEFQKVVIDVASTLCAQLIEAGVPGIHLFTLNKLAVAKQVQANIVGKE